MHSPSPAKLESKPPGGTLESIKLPRGGVLVSTSVGPVQLGMPPETIKDSMKLGLPVPRHFIVPSEPFTKSLGANMGVNVAEFEFPAYCNFFFKRQSINLIVASEDVERRIRQVFQETLFGPVELDLTCDYPHATPASDIPDLDKELKYFRKFGDTLMTINMLLNFTHFDEKGEAHITAANADNGEEHDVVIRKGPDSTFTIQDGPKAITLADSVDLPSPPQPEYTLDTFYPPAFGVTVLGSSHGFDPAGKTSGYVLWINHRGIMIDPPPFSSSILLANNIPALMIDGVILTHCHADHDAGTFQKILQEGRVALITTHTIYQSFLRKYSALSGFAPSFLERVLDHRLVRINEISTIRGADFRFFYSLHSIPCVGFEVAYGDKKVVFSGDHLNDPERIEQLHSDGVISASRCHELLNFPWHGDVILHEAGVPPIHTPLKTLMALDESIRQRLYVVHTAAKDVPSDSGLKGATEGVHNTITVPGRLPENAGALEILDLVRKIDLFAGLTLNHAYEILQMARKVKFAKGSMIQDVEEDGDTFYIIILGEAQAVYQSEQARSSRAVDNEQTNLVHDYSAGSNDDGAVPIPTHSSHMSAHHQTRGEAKRPSLLAIAKSYIPGDYFDLQSLLTPHWKIPYRMTAVTNVSALAFNASAFNWFLRHTTAFGRIHRLAESRLNFSHDILEANSVFRKLTSSQRTALELILDQRKIENGSTVWKSGDSWEFAILIDSGEFILTQTPGSQSPSKQLCSVKSSPPSSASRIGRKTRGSGNRIVPLDASTLSEEAEEITLGRGSFVGDVDKLSCINPTPEGSADQTANFHGTTLTCSSTGIVFYIFKNDLQAFLFEYPGLLMTLAGCTYVN